MQIIQKVAILGAGAMGAYFAGRFFDTSGFSTVLIATGQRKDRLEKNGLVVNGKSYILPVLDPEETASPADLIIVALKHQHLKDAVAGLNKLVGPDTTFISVMNGLDSEEYIGSIYGMDKVLYTISVAIDAVRQDNRITYSKPGKHYFGQAVNTRNDLSQRVRCVQQAFDRAGIVYETPDDMIRMLWWKFMINVGINQASAVLRAPYGVFQTSADARDLTETLMREVISLAAVMKVNLSEKDIEQWYVFQKTLSPQGKTSMLQDIEAKRKTEVEMFAGKVVELGQTHGVATPVNQAVYRIIRVLECNFQ
jgi:2-dehydropantoate 2-reductase